MDQSKNTTLATCVRHTALCETTKERAVATAIAACVALLIGLGAGALWYLANGATSVGVWYNKYFMLFVTMVVFCGLLFWVYRKELAKHPDTLFLLAMLTLTLGSSWLYDVNRVSWDVGAHFRYAWQWLTVVDPGRGITVAENEIFYGVQNEYHTEIATLANWKNWMNEASGLAATSGTLNPMTALTRLPSLPGGIVLGICSALGVPIATSYLLAKLPYAVIYSFLCWGAMRQLKSGKMIVAAVAMIPTALFVCESYGYDYWVNGFTLLAVAAVVGVIQRPDERVTPSKATFILVAFLLAYLPKFVYAPLALIALLIPSSRFGTKKQAWAFRAACFGVILLTMLVLFIPTLMKKAVSTTGQPTGDMRGGSDVNASVQIGFVVNNFGYYVFQVLLPFLFTYLAPWNASDYLGLHGYLGVAPTPLWIGSLVLLVWVALTDKSRPDEEAAHWWDRLWAGTLSFGVLAVAASALYVDYTAVAADTIAGFQGRYFIPFLFITLYFMGIPSIGEKIRPRVRHYNAIVLVALTAIALLSTWCVYVSLIY